MKARDAVGLTEDERRQVETARRLRERNRPLVQFADDLLAIIDRLSTAPVDDRERVPEGWRVEWLIEEPEGPGCGPRRTPYLDQIPAVSDLALRRSRGEARCLTP